MAEKKITKITSAEETEETKLKDITQPTNTTLLDTMKIVDTIGFFTGLGNEGYRNTFRNDLSTKECTPLQNANIVLLEGKFSESDKRTDFKGIELAFNLLLKHPNNPMILTSFMSEEYFRHEFPKSVFLFSKPNVKFIKLPYTPNDLLNIFKEPKENQEAKESILDTIQFYDVQGRYPYLKEFFATLDLSKFHLKNSIVVDLRADDKKFVSKSNNARSDMSGLKISYETFQKDPNAKIILCSLIPIDVFKQVIAGTKSEEYLTTLLQGKNVRIIQSLGGNSMTQEEVLKQFDDMCESDEDTATSSSGEIFTQVAYKEKKEAFQKVFEGEIGRFLHSARYDLPNRKDLTNVEQLAIILRQEDSEKSEKLIDFENQMILLLQLQYPSYKKVSRERNLGGILATYEFIQKEELPEGTQFPGIFIDRDGCLYNLEKKEFNKQVIDIIKEYEKEGKEITIRTQGNIDIKQKQLEEIGLPYQVKNKIDYKGGTVEIAIDDDTPEKLLANSRVRAKKHIQI